MTALKNYLCSLQLHIARQQAARALELPDRPTRHPGAPTLPAPHVPAILVHGGLNKSDLHDPLSPVVVQVVLQLSMLKDDNLYLYMNDRIIAGHTLRNDDITNGLVTFYVLPAEFPFEGEVILHYHHLVPPSSAFSTSRDVGPFPVKQTVPGNPDTDPSTLYINERLRLPSGIPSNPAPNNDLLVTIPRYDNLCKGDIVTLYWAGVPIKITVSGDQASNPDIPITIVVPASIIADNPGSKLTVRYDVRDIVNNWSLYSLAVQVTVTRPGVFPPPLVDQAPNYILDVDVLNGDDVRIMVLVHPHFPIANTPLTVIWRGSPVIGPAMEVRLDTHTTTPYSPVTVLLPHRQAAALAGSTAQVLYEAYVDDSGNPGMELRQSDLLTLTVIGTPPRLAKPHVVGVFGTVLDPDKITGDYQEVIVPAYDFMDIGDEITVHWEGVTTSGTTVYDAQQIFISQPSQIGKPHSVSFEKRLATLLRGGNLEVSYSVKVNGQSYLSEPALLQVGQAAVSTLTVMGSRSQTSPFYHANTCRLQAASPDSQATFEWHYQGFSERSTDAFFLDTHPEQPLLVRSTKTGGTIETLTLRPVNATGNASFSAYRSGCIVKDDGTIFGWGAGAIAPPANLAGIRCVVANSQAYAGLHTDGSVTCWGNADNGGSAPAGLRDVAQVAAASSAFAALHQNGSVTTWGNALHGGTVPPVIATQLFDIVQIVGADSAFAALRNDGEVFCWGGDQWPYGMHVIAARGSERLSASNNAFAAVTSRRSVVAWGLESDGGRIPAELVSQLTGVISLASTSAAFAALTATGRVLVWGNTRFGGQLPAPVTNILYVTGSTTAFAAITLNNSVVAWGEPNEGGTPPPNLQAVSLTAGYGSFAACRPDGSVVSWGVTTGQYSANDARAVYAVGANFLVLTADQKVVSWGSDNLDLQSLAGQVTQTI